MEAIVRISGKQYRVAEGDRLTVERLASGIGEKVSFSDVLLLTDGARAHVGTPVVDGAAVTATVMALTRGPKLIVYKYKAKKRYRRTRGARAEQTLLQVVSVTGPGAKSRTAPKEADTRAAAAVEKPPRPAAAETDKPTASETTKPAAAEKPAKAAAKSPAKAKTAKPTAAKKPRPRTKQE